ncbi:sensor histidine kinase [Papillibacter cinnamivorans]|uniref:Sensor_kinase_SpoOB-type, alpha-helical domain n=1 Tax=Papillibacter cinnamivorans DSM 12816 TaxID=1122930 RepID=A0A1W2AJE3_9FIRM|nr:sensor histidine kinase [Papillibacter cinnamivorans]SMC60680.1 Sensor_kinase_SpoOB-type, alpha-helical domain [Papillibacter cinnamivorans DSM 12816]
MNIIWIGIETIVNLIEVYLFLYLINCKFPPKTDSKIPFVVALIINTAGMTLISLGLLTWIPDLIFEPAIVLIYVILFRKGKLFGKIFWTLIGTAIIAAIAILGIAIGLQLPGVTLEIISYQQSATRFQLLIFCKFVQFIVFYFLAKKRSMDNLTNGFIKFLFIFAPLTSFLIMFLLFEYGLGPVNTVSSQFLLLGASLGILLINFIIFAFYDSLSAQVENNLLMQAKLQQSDMLQKHNQEISSLYEEIRGWRHDFHNHLQVLHGYLQLGKYDKLENYLNDMKDSSDVLLSACSGNTTIDAILGTKMIIARNHKIAFSTDIEVPSCLTCKDTDLCILLGNLLDNAIEACDKIENPDQEQFISVEMKVLKNQLYIHVRNSTNGVVKMSGSTYISDKAGSFHGIGLKHIDEIAEKYGGYVNRKHELCLFESQIMIPLVS